MEYWSTGVRLRGWMSLYSTPILHYSTIDKPTEFRQSRVGLFIGYRSEYL